MPKKCCRNFDPEMSAVSPGVFEVFRVFVFVRVLCRSFVAISLTYLAQSFARFPLSSAWSQMEVTNQKIYNKSRGFLSGFVFLIF